MKHFPGFKMSNFLCGSPYLMKSHYKSVIKNRSLG